MQYGLLEQHPVQQQFQGSDAMPPYSTVVSDVRMKREGRAVGEV